MKNTLTLKEITDQSSLEALLKLRYEVYQTSPLIGFSPPNRYCISLDIWDFYSRHFGVYHDLNGTSTLIGYLRLIEPILTNTAPQILDIALNQNRKFATELIEKDRLQLIPCAAYFKEAQNQSDNTGIEVGRFAIKKEYRKKWPTAMIIMQLIAGLCVHHFKYNFAYIICMPKHAPMYQSIGFQLVSEEIKTIHKVPFNCLKIAPENFSKEVREYLLQITQQYPIDGFVSFELNQFQQ